MILSALAATALAGTAAASAAQTEARCVQVSASSFLIDGPTDKTMLECVRAKLGAQTTELIVRSGGGNTEAAMDIAELVARPGLTVRVQENCYSSCANYLIPVASRLVVDPAATIVVHGGIDPLLIQSDMVANRAKRIKELAKAKPHLSKAQVEAEYAKAVNKVIALAERQKAFARKHNVGPGWFLYRDIGDKGFGRYLTGEAGPKPHPFGWRLLLVEEPMLRSCLPAVQVVPFQAALERNFIDNPARFQKFRKAEGRRSLGLRCTPG